MIAGKVVAVVLERYAAGASQCLGSKACHHINRGTVGKAIEGELERLGIGGGKVLAQQHASGLARVD